MATVILNSPSFPPESQAPAIVPQEFPGLPEGVPYRQSSEDLFRMVESDLFPLEKRIRASRPVNSSRKR